MAVGRGLFPACVTACFPHSKSVSRRSHTPLKRGNFERLQAGAARPAAHFIVLGGHARRAARALRRVRRANDANARGITVSLRRRSCLLAAPHSRGLTRHVEGRGACRMTYDIEQRV